MEKVTDKTEALSAIKKETLALENVSDELKADKEVVMAAVELGSWEFEHASDELKADKEFVLEVIKINVDQFETASDELKADKEFVMKVVELSGWALEYASDELKADKEVVMAAVNNDGVALTFASDEHKADKEVVMAAVKNDVCAMEYVSDELKADKEVVMAAVKENSYAFQFSSDKLKADKEVIALQKNHDSEKEAEKNEMELNENTTYRIAILDNERLILNMVYTEVDEEIFGVYSGMIRSGPHVCYFHQYEFGKFNVSDDYFEFETNHDLKNIFIELDDLRNEFEIWDDEGDSFKFSNAGKEFIAANELINDDGWLEAYSEGASEDFIYDLQNEWQLSLRKN